MKPTPFWRGFAVGALVLMSAEASLFAAMFFLIIRPMAGRLPSGGPAPPPLPVEREADYSLKLRGQYGAPFMLKQYEGKLVVLNLWAGWCAPCMNELPSLQRLKEATKADPAIEVLCVNMETPEKARKALSEEDGVKSSGRMGSSLQC